MSGKLVVCSWLCQSQRRAGSGLLDIWIEVLTAFAVQAHEHSVMHIPYDGARRSAVG